MGLDPAALVLMRADAIQRADPLESYKCATWGQRALLDHLRAGRKVVWLAGNSGAKTTSGLATDIAFLQGRSYLNDADGSRIALPVIKPPVFWLLGVDSYKLASLSTLPKIRQLLGNWPHHEERVGADNVASITIKHRLSRTSAEDRSDWSRLIVFTYESGVMPEAMRLNGWHCDEPPPLRFLDALMNRKIAGQTLYGFLTMTPIERRFWEPVLAQFPTENGRVEGGRVRIQSSVYDNRALHRIGCAKVGHPCDCPDILAAEEAVARSPWRLARLYGDPVDAAGTCPFDMDELVAMRESCTDGTKCAQDWAWNDNREVPIIRQHERGQVESWGWPGEWDCAIIVADPSSGVREPDKTDAQQPRNPCGLAMGSVAERRLMLRFNGYVRAHELGVMARAVANKCPRWLLIHETNGGWGETFLRGFQEAKAVTRGEIWYDTDPITGKLATEPGWNQTATRRGLLLSSLQRAIETRGLGIPSRAALDNLLQVRLDKNERWDQGDGRGPHGEDVITLGIMAYAMERTAVRKPPVRLSERPEMARIFAPQNGHAEAPQERW